MSWAEVKKINSDLSKPLNELLLDEAQKCVYGLKTSRVYVSSTTDVISSTFKTLVSVTGKGCLANALFYGYLGGSSTAQSCLVKLTVDDEVILNLKFNPTYGGSTAKIEVTTGILNLKSGIVSSNGFSPFFSMSNISGGSTLTSKLDEIFILTNAAQYSRDFLEFSPNLQELGTSSIPINETGELLELVLMNKLLRFNKGFKLEVASGDANNIKNYEHLVTYTLDD
ncbi:MAG: hypothetical protein IJA10_10405 [Lachnospiraceae bacterium]|nr:hypothetical protein [Lachnospiraceae bacterium]